MAPTPRPLGLILSFPPENRIWRAGIKARQDYAFSVEQSKCGVNAGARGALHPGSQRLRHLCGECGLQEKAGIKQRFHHGNKGIL